MGKRTIRIRRGNWFGHDREPLFIRDRLFVINYKENYVYVCELTCDRFHYYRYRKVEQQAPPAQSANSLTASTASLLLAQFSSVQPASQPGRSAHCQFSSNQPASERAQINEGGETTRVADQRRGGWPVVLRLKRHPMADSPGEWGASFYRRGVTSQKLL
jgi:hypothetical protein